MNFLPTWGLVHDEFSKVKICGQTPGVSISFDLFMSRGLPSLFIYVAVAAGQDPGAGGSLVSEIFTSLLFKDS